MKADIPVLHDGDLRHRDPRCAFHARKVGGLDGDQIQLTRTQLRDLGELLICNSDFAMADELGLRLERTKTCMNGDGMCDFCYHVKGAETPRL